MATDRGIVFFDDNCLLCNHFVIFLLKKDKKHRLLFASLSNKLAEKYLSPDMPERNNSVLFVKENKVYTKSTAVLQLFRQLSGLWNFLGLFYVIPRFIRNYIYDRIAANRNKLWKNKFCYLPTDSEKQYFLN